MRHVVGQRLDGGGIRLRHAALTAFVEGQHVLAEAVRHGATYGVERLLGSLAFGGEEQLLAAAGTKVDHLGQAGSGHRGATALGQSHLDRQALFPSRLHQLLGRAGMQSVGVEYPGQPGMGRGGFAGQAGQYGGGIGTGQLGGGTAVEQGQNALQQAAVGVPLGGQAEHPLHRFAAALQALIRRGQGQRRHRDAALAEAEPQPLAQRRQLAFGDLGDETAAHAAELTQPGGAGQSQFARVAGRKAEAQSIGVQARFHLGLRQQGRHGRRRARAGQTLADAVVVEYVGELAQDVQMLVALSGDGDQHVNALAIVPLDAGGKLQYAYAGGQHVLAAFRRAVGDGDGVAEVGGGLRLALEQAVAVGGGGQPCPVQRFGGLLQRIAPVRRLAVEADVLGA